ncbi:hypothetical protein [Enterococcus thailandicus]|uniref:hypothetical protein n=1 Tax=Enterococcus thailandicus TaxID=417368 RepID=UPI0022E5537D|nr:hypothetical protein [Enterococcus thailandicus]
MNQNIMPVFREKSNFYKKYARYSVPEMLRMHGFSVSINPIDDEDIVHIEKTKVFLMSKGIVDEPLYFKQEFFAEYPLENTSLIVEGYYKRIPTGEKMYNSYSYSLYKASYQSHLGTVANRMYAERVNKIVFLNTFEKKLPLIEGGENGLKED